MLLLTNQYQVMCKEPSICRAGQFVYNNIIKDNDEIGDIVGFVSKVLENGNVIEITTFDVIDVSSLPILWCNKQVVNSMDILLKICEQDAQIREMWKDAASTNLSTVEN